VSDLLSPERIAQDAGVSIDTVYRAIHRRPADPRRLRASKLGARGAYRIRPEDYEAWLDATVVGETADLEPRTRRERAAGAGSTFRDRVKSAEGRAA
jgi:hypothetical protein